MRINSQTIRETFLTFFEQHGHLRIDGTSVQSRNDPTLLFVNSGMAPLKRYFTGEAVPPAKDLCNIQSCIRTKDIDDVGDRHHLTFFEMMGSWSIGNYFKDRAIELAFALLTEGFNFRPEQLYVTVFEGDKKLGLPPDEASAIAWERVGMPRDHIVPQPTADNFWGPAGGAGPCGPCTEVFLDTGDAYGNPYQPGGDFDTKRRYIEVWNAGVFMEFEKSLDGSFRPLPFTSVDTGSGLERMCLALNGLDNVYETDLLRPVVASVQHALGDSGEWQPHHMVVGDHMRAAVKILSDGVLPSNEGSGYVVRRLIRKSMTIALRHSAERFNFRPIVDEVVLSLGKQHPDVAHRKDAVMTAFEEECREFDEAMRRGLDRLSSLVKRKNAVSGVDAFQLFSTYGLPVEITRDIAAERGVTVSMEEYEEEVQEHKKISRAKSHAEPRLRTTDVLPTSVSRIPETEFVGYDDVNANAVVQAIFVKGSLVDSAVPGQDVDVVVDRTPFYAEGGGQVGDRGAILADEGSGFEGTVKDTVCHVSGRYIHRVHCSSGKLSAGAKVRLEVDRESRYAAMANHTGTHLLNAALREVLGTHVTQAGSLVDALRLRFDFTHPKPLTADELSAVETLVNQWVLEDHERHVEVSTPEAAKQAGALSLDGEDYDENVRVVRFGSVSKELCGGTHVAHTSFIGSFRIASEQSTASGIRRITAVTRHAAAEHSLTQGISLSDVARSLRTDSAGVVEGVQRLMRRAAAKKGREGAVAASGSEDVTRSSVNGIDVAVLHGPADTAALRRSAQRLSHEEKRVAMCWGAESRKAVVVVSVPENRVAATSAVTLLRELMTMVGGTGGGNERIAQGGGELADGGASLPDRFIALLGSTPV
ncbi:alanine--tRNA ligase [Streptomyces sp. NPDC020707]|uniref:alanine--tRNA ligase n=1 Tax=Streptomyces sp. NPDC020707 TaxID=3365084 RepID=UPI00379514F1